MNLSCWLYVGKFQNPPIARRVSHTRCIEAMRCARVGVVFVPLMKCRAHSLGGNEWPLDTKPLATCGLPNWNGFFSYTYTELKLQDDFNTKYTNIQVRNTSVAETRLLLLPVTLHFEDRKHSFLNLCLIIGTHRHRLVIQTITFLNCHVNKGS